MTKNELSLITSNKLHTQKAISLVSLFKMGVIAPSTIILQDDSEVKKANEIAQGIKSEYFYVRVNFPDNSYPHHLSAFSLKQNLSIDLKSLLFKAKELNKPIYDIIIQPLINFQWSGVALIKSDFILIEIVFGHPNSLLRLGEYKFRFLFDKHNNLLDINEGPQDTYMEWEKNELTRSSKVIRNDSIDEILVHLKQIRKDECLLYEIGFSKPYLYYLEFKQTNPLSFNDVKNNVIQKPFRIFSGVDSGNRNKKLSLKKPSLDNIESISIGVDITIETGAFLSHLSTYSAYNNINCTFLN